MKSSRNLAIILIFSTLNIPRTPLAVSMFLWIIEQQENYKPINNATMLENFIERLFKKQSSSEIYSEKFDYRNKERLLAEISFFMYSNKQINYRVSKRDLIKFIYDHLRALKFGFQEDEVLNEFG
jgi:predicted NACHT family NTPase